MMDSKLKNILTMRRERGMSQILWAKCRNQLTWIWLGGFVALAVMAMIVGVRNDNTSNDYNKQLFSWFLPAIVPSLTLLLGAVFHDVFAVDSKKVYVKKVAFQIALGLSIFYLLFVLLTLLLQFDWIATKIGAQVRGISSLQNMSIMLSVCQGLVSLALGALFVQRD